MRLSVDDIEYQRLTPEQKTAVRYWVARYVDPCECVAFELGTDDGRTFAARFHSIHWFDMTERSLDVLKVAPCPYPFD